MSFIKAFSGAIGGSFADQWKDFYTVPSGISGSVGICRAVPSSANLQRSANTSGNNYVITNGSLILVPEGFALVTMENGSVTGFISDPGGYKWTSDSVNSQSFFAETGAVSSLVRQSWDRFKYGGSPAAAQIPVFVNLKEIPDNKFGTQTEIYWDDSYLNAQVGAVAYGTYTLRITDPILFLKNFVPAEYYLPGGPVFDFADYDNQAAEQLFSEVVSSLAGAFSSYVNGSSRNHRITSIQQDNIGFGVSLSNVVEDNYHWRDKRGLAIDSVSLMSVDYDSGTKALLEKVKQADALMGARGNSNLQASFADGIQMAGGNPNGGALGMGVMGIGLQGIASAAGLVQQPSSSQASYGISSDQNINDAGEDPYEKLAKLKKLLDLNVISQEEFDAVKEKVLNL